MRNSQTHEAIHHSILFHVDTYEAMETAFTFSYKRLPLHPLELLQHQGISQVKAVLLCILSLWSSVLLALQLEREGESINNPEKL